MLTATDDFPTVLAIAESMLGSRAVRVRTFAAGLYAALFALYGGEEGARERLLRGLVSRAAAAPASNAMPPAKVRITAIYPSAAGGSCFANLRKDAG